MKHLIMFLFESVLRHTPRFVLRKIYTSKKILGEISVECPDGAVLYCSSVMKPCVKNVVLQISNSLPIPIFVEDLNGKLMHYKDTYVRNLHLPIKRDLPQHATISHTWECDIAALPGLARRKDGSVIPLEVVGEMGIEATGRRMTKGVSTRLAALIRTD